MYRGFWARRIMSWGFRPALPLTGGFWSRLGYVRGVCPTIAFNTLLTLVVSADLCIMHVRSYCCIIEHSLLYVHNTYTNVGDRCFAAAGPRLWNTLLLQLRLCDSFGQFQRLLKTFLTHFCLACETTTPCDISLKCTAYKSAYLLT